MPGVFHYVLVLPDGDASLSPFQGFSAALLQRAPSIKRLALLPVSAFELFVGKDIAMRNRAMGMAPLNITLLHEGNLKNVPPYPFTCLVSNEGSAEKSSAYVEKTGFPLLHLSTGKEERPGTTRLARADRQVFFDWLSVIREYFANRGRPEYLDALPWDRGFNRWTETQDGRVARRHNSTLPNEFALGAFGITPSRIEAFEPVTVHESEDVDARYVAAISESASAVAGVRSALTEGQPVRPGTVSLLLTAPSVVRDVRSLANKGKSVLVRRFTNQMFRQEHYPQLVGDPNFMMDVGKDPYATRLMDVRRAEFGLYTAGLAVYAAGHLCPVLRLPPVVNRVGAIVQRLAGALRSGTPHKRIRANALGFEVGNWLSQHVPQSFQQQIGKHQTGVKLVGDAPLEWLPVRSVPLGLRYSTSRIPGTPGDVETLSLVQGNVVQITKSEATNVLVIRSFTENDPIKPLLEASIRRFAEEVPNRVALNVVDVSSKDELVRVLNESRTAIVVFDCHGTHDPISPIGTLRIGEENINPADLGYTARIPPIVILSACETHPLDSSHLTVGGGFLRVGATTVLSTASRVDARIAALIIGRLILRLAEFVAILPPPFLWSEVIGGLLRMSYTFDVLRALAPLPQVGLRPQDLVRIQMLANGRINNFQDDWFENLLIDIAAASSQPVNVITDLWREHAYASESLLYLQLGNPENVWIVNDGDDAFERNK